MSLGRNGILRIRAIDQAIRSKNKPYPTMNRLREVCEEILYGSSGQYPVSVSTIEKDLKTLRNDYGAPIKYCRTNKGYYYTDKNYTLEDAPLTKYDEESVKKAIGILGNYKNYPLLKQFSPSIDRITSRVNISSDVQDKAIDEFVQFESSETVKGNEFLDKILKAIKQKNTIQFSYEKFQNNEKKIRRLHPYLLKEYRHRWYVIGKSEIDGDVKTFALDRVTDLEVLTTEFVRDNNFSPDIFFKHVIGITTGNDFPKIIRISTNTILSKYLLSQPLHHSQVYKGTSKDGEEHLFEYYLLITYELIAQLLSFGSQVTVLEPQELRDKIKAESAKIVTKYH